MSELLKPSSTSIASSLISKGTPDERNLAQKLRENGQVYVGDAAEKREKVAVKTNNSTSDVLDVSRVLLPDLTHSTGRVMQTPIACTGFGAKFPTATAMLLSNILSKPLSSTGESTSINPTANLKNILDWCGPRTG